MNDYEFAQAQMKALNEATNHAGPSIFAHVLLHGQTAVGELVAAAQDVQANGGMMRQDGQPRTLGGVYFQLAKAAGWEVRPYKLRRELAAIGGV